MANNDEFWEEVFENLEESLPSVDNFQLDPQIPLSTLTPNASQISRVSDITKVKDAIIGEVIYDQTRKKVYVCSEPPNEYGDGVFHEMNNFEDDAEVQQEAEEIDDFYGNDVNSSDGTFDVYVEPHILEEQAKAAQDRSDNFEEKMRMLAQKEKEITRQKSELEALKSNKIVQPYKAPVGERKPLFGQDKRELDLS